MTRKPSWRHQQAIEAAAKSRANAPAQAPRGLIAMNHEMIQAMLDRIDGKITGEEFVQRYLDGQDKAEPC